MRDDGILYVAFLTVLFKICDAQAASTKAKDEFMLSPENGNNPDDMIDEDFSECTKTKRFQECIGSFQTALIFTGAVIFVVTLCCTLICCKICFDIRERKRKRREDLLCQVTGYAIVANLDAEQDRIEQDILAVQLNTEIQGMLHEDPDPPPMYPGPEQEAGNGRMMEEDEPPPYSPSFRRGTVLDLD